MATADELLAGMSTEGDTTLVIDNYLRTINIPKSITNLGVESDDDVLRLNFRMPRYLDDTDLSPFPIRINYLNARGESDAYTVNDKVVTSSHITFSWLVGPTATAYKGNTKFNVCMKILNGEGYVDREYNTTVATLPVLEGLEVDERIVEEYSDILEQWRQQLFGIGSTEEASMRAVSKEEQENIAQKGAEVLATIPEDYQTTYKNAEEGVRTKGDAIVCKVEGSMISITDSSDDHVRELKLIGHTTQVCTTGKNLFDVTRALANQKRGTTVVNEYTAYKNGVRVTSNSYDHGRAYMHLPLEAGTYNISANVKVVGGWNFSVKNYDTNVELVNQTTTVAGAISYSFTLDAAALVGFCFMSVNTNGPATIATDIQLEYGTEATAWEPYSGGFASPSPEWPQELVSTGDSGSVVVKMTGKNLLNPNGVTQTNNGVTFTNNGDGTFTVNGTSTGAVGFALTNLSTHPLHLIKGLTYTQSIEIVSGSKNVKAVVVPSAKNVHGVVSYNYLTDNQTKTADMDYDIYSYTLYMDANVTVNFRFRVQLEINDHSTTYEPYRDIQKLTYTLPDKFCAGTLDCVTGDMKYASISVPQTSQWAPGRTTSGWVDGIDSIGKATIPFHFHLGNKKDNYFPATLCSHFPAAKSWEEIVGSRTEMAYRGNAAGLSFVAIRIKRSRLAPYGFTDDDNVETAIAAFEAWLVAQTEAGTPVQFVGAISETATVESYDPITNNPTTVIINDAGARMQLSYNADTKIYVDNGIARTVTEVMEAIENGSY